MDILSLTSTDEQQLVIALVPAVDFESAVDGIVEVSWAGFAGAGYKDQTIAEIWRDDLDDNVQPDGSLSISLGRWHTLPAGEVARFKDWIEALLAGREPTAVGPRLRPSALA